jgi:hypothetical protein
MAFKRCRALSVMAQSYKANTLAAWHAFATTQIFDRGFKIIESAGCAESFVDDECQASITRYTTELHRKPRTSWSEVGSDCQIFAVPNERAPARIEILNFRATSSRSMRRPLLCVPRDNIARRLAPAMPSGFPGSPTTRHDSCNEALFWELKEET